MIKHIMKDPEDLDPFSDEQVVITRVLDAGGKGKIRRLVMMAATLQLQIDAIAYQGKFSAEEWQRAAYEAHQSCKADPNRVNKMLAESLWSMVRYIQDGVNLAREGIKDPEIIKIFEDRGRKAPSDKD